MKLNFLADKFRAEYFQQRPVLLKSAFRSDLFSWEDLDELLYVVDVDSKSVRFVKDKLVPEQEFSETSHHYGLFRRTFNKACIYSGLDSGATLVLNRMEQKSLRIKRLCNELAHVAKGQVVANGYLACSGESAFGNHWDSHDVFASQLLGCKRWVIYPPTFNNPIVGQRSVDHREDCPTEAWLDVVTEPGDILYIPRGWWHCAYPSEGPCFHAAVGVHKPYVIDYLNWVTANVLSRDSAFRKTLDLDGVNALDKSMLADMCESVLDEHNFQSFEKHVYNRENIDTGMHLAMYYGLSTAHCKDVLIKWASPFEDMSLRLEIAVEGVILKEHPIGKHLSNRGQKLASLKSDCSLDPSTFETHLRALISIGAVVLYT